ncbi:MAG: hypothetical protein RJA76_1778 [Bacteroidota bacterium]|jgi:hypothetical protein
MGRTSLLISLIISFICSTDFFAVGQIKSKIFEKHKGIHTVFISTNQSNEIIKQNPVISIEQQSNWYLNFDDLDLNYKNYFLRIIHCDNQWKPSNLNEIEYLVDFNDQPIREFTTSYGTKVPYNHYQVNLPKGKIAGNYVALLYANRNKQDSVFAIRYSVLENFTTIGAKINFANQNEFRKSHQSVQLGFSYKEELIINDESNLKVIIRKMNGNINLLPRLPRPIHNVQDKKFLYQFFSVDGLIAGGNEYRLIDLRSAQQKLSFVNILNQQDEITHIVCYPESPQGYFSYTNRNDINGSFIIGNYENPSNSLYADYVKCLFQLKSREIKDGIVYIEGGFSNLMGSHKLLMTYNQENGMYEKEVLLKQGIYNYKFGGNADTNEFLEGNFSQTENEYEVMIYFQQPGTRYDSLIGYQLVKFP